jgi:hypothetical protein
MAEKRESIFIDRPLGGEEPNLFVSVNGVNYLLPRGATSQVPAPVAREILRSRRAQERLDKKITEMKGF